MNKWLLLALGAAVIGGGVVVAKKQGLLGAAPTPAKPAPKPAPLPTARNQQASPASNTLPETVIVGTPVIELDGPPVQDWPVAANGAIANGEGMKEVQTRLNAWGFPASIDGIFGPETSAATRGFQTKVGISVDGIPGRQTLAELRKSPTTVGQLAQVVVAQNFSTQFPLAADGGIANGPGIAEVETRLQALGLYNGGIDGIRGPGVTSGTRTFQQRAGLSPDGIPGPKTLAALRDRTTLQAA